MAEPLTREAFERSRAAAGLAARRDGRMLAAFSVALAVIQLIFLRWADAHLARGPTLAIALPVFVVYIVVVGVLLWRMERRKRSAGPICPQCGISLTGLSERVAAATGRCDSCGGLVVGGEQADRPSVGRPTSGSPTG
jgi:ribosomal protein L37AE/L43A